MSRSGQNYSSMASEVSTAEGQFFSKFHLITQHYSINRGLSGKSGETAGMTTPRSGILALYLPWLDPGTVFKLNKEPNDKLGRGQHRPDLTTITGRVSGQYRRGKLLFGLELGNPIFSFRFPCSVTDSSTFLPASGMMCLENSEASTWSLLPAVSRLPGFLSFQIQPKGWKTKR